MKFYFVRHGESEANVLHEVSNRGFKHPLTDKGCQQARALIESLREVPIIKVYSSPLMRAVQVAEMLADAYQVPCEITDALREYDCGVIEGKSDEASWEWWRQLRRDWFEAQQWDSRIEGGECFYDIQQRFVPFIHGLLDQDRERSGAIVMVGHGGTYGCMLPLVLQNISFESDVLARGMSYTGAVIAETRPDGLYCVSWCGETVE